MSRCPSCTSQIPEGSRFCSNCGISVAVGLDSAPTMTSVPESAAGGGTSVRHSSAHVGRLSSTDPAGHGRFLPGTVLQNRYRIIGILGRGGMGEVFRADDLKLDQPVALKFLPEALEHDPGRLARFLQEVKIARQVSHANVCRVYDVGDVDGQHYISMEYVDGEDLSTLLKRIGRVSNDKAVEIARQICAGLAAAHVRGIIHRDLKPANIMLDGEGRVRITDFGLAGLAEGIQGAEVRAGTPDYMSPEQLEGKGVSPKSDIYSLGHVLYELFTGKRAFQSDSLTELRQLQSEATPTRPSSLVDQINPAAERVIMRCLEKDPALRPDSALGVAAALPGGDPLAAALAAGETPSPEMVAAAGEEGILTPGRAVASLGVVLAGVAVYITLAPMVQMVHRIPLEKPPQALAVEARELLATLGSDPPVDRAWSFSLDGGYFAEVDREDKSPGRWDDLDEVHPRPVLFWYRESPRPLVATRFQGSVSANNPPLLISGMTRVRMDTEGRLRGFLAVPPQYDTDPPTDEEPDWSPLFAAAGFSPEKLDEAMPEWNPTVASDVRRAWTGTHPERPETEVRIEAAGYRGKPVFFSVISPWARPTRMGVQPPAPGQTAVNIILLSLLSLILIGGGLLTRHNLRLGRVDQRGALRLAAYVFVVTLLAWALGAHHVASTSEVGLFLLGAVPNGLLAASLVVLVYLALEPYVRKLWPEVLISWSRLLAGRLRDPRVGRDVLLGLVLGASSSILIAAIYLVPKALGEPGLQPDSSSVASLDGLRSLLSNLLSAQPNQLFVTMALLFLLLLFKRLFKHQWVTVLAGTAVMFLIMAVGNPSQKTVWILGTLFWLVMILTMMRIGLLAALVAAYTPNALSAAPVSWDLSTWYAGWSGVGIVLLLGVAAWAFRTSLAGRPLFKDELAQEA